ncbi:MAG: hypothetical protein IBX62_00950 [Coriobacteriia bacterium]|nr:hypothetical protein [Coriobacteriia bacterium]
MSGAIRMEPAGFVYAAIVLTAYAVLAWRSRRKAAQAVRTAGRSLAGMATTFLAVFALVGLFEVYVSADVIRAAMGPAAGWTSLLVGGLAGSFAAGPSSAAFPIARSLLDAGGSVAAVRTGHAPAVGERDAVRRVSETREVGVDAGR